MPLLQPGQGRSRLPAAGCKLPALRSCPTLPPRPGPHVVDGLCSRGGIEARLGAVGVQPNVLQRAGRGLGPGLAQQHAGRAGQAIPPAGLLQSLGAGRRREQREPGRALGHRPGLPLAPRPIPGPQLPRDPPHLDVSQQVALLVDGPHLAPVQTHAPAAARKHTQPLAQRSSSGVCVLCSTFARSMRPTAARRMHQLGTARARASPVGQDALRLGPAVHGHARQQLEAAAMGDLPQQAPQLGPKAGQREVLQGHILRVRRGGKQVGARRWGEKAKRGPARTEGWARRRAMQGASAAGCSARHVPVSSPA